MRSIYGRLALVALLSTVTITACRARSVSTVPSGNRNILTRAQLGESRFTTAYDAVEALRSNWFNTRGADSFQRPSIVRVYLDNVSLGDKETLRTIAITSISYIQYFDGVSATSRWGVNHGAGVIFVSTRPDGPGGP
jgi:hypothetical protein